MCKRKNHKSFGKVSFFVVILFICTISSAKVIYVDDSAAGASDGSSWENAYIYLQDALAEAVEGDEIRVAHGIYTPDLGGGNIPGDMEATFLLKNGVAIKGGYVGLDIPGKSDERAFNIFETILSGYIGENSDANHLSSFDYSFTVVTGSFTDETAILDGFTISNNGNLGLNTGACVHIISGGPTISNCTFIEEYTGSMIKLKSTFHNTNGSNPTIIDCIFIGNADSTSLPPNLSTSQIMMENVESSPVLTNCTFKNCNDCIDNDNSDMELNNCVFRNNAGIIIMQDKGNLIAEGCSFIDNSKTITAGPRIISPLCCIKSLQGNLTIKDCVFQNNSYKTQDSSNSCISNSNGIMLVKDSKFSGNSGLTISNNSVGRTRVYKGNTSITNCDFINNSGGAIVGSDMLIENCRFSGNSVPGYGAIYVSTSNIHNCIFEANNGSAISIIPNAFRENLNNCTFYGNTGTESIIKNTSDIYTLNLTNCIIRNNETNVIEGSNIISTYCNIEGGLAGEGNIDIDPLFVRAGYWADINDIDMEVAQDDPNAIWIMGDYHLQSQAGRWDSDSQTWVKDEISSPCIDAGNINSPIGLEPFPNGGISNLGAYGRSDKASKTYFEGNDSDVILAGDINGDSIVDYDDLYVIVSQWLLEGKDFINQAPIVTIVKPYDGEQITWAGKIRIEALVEDLDGEIASVQFLLRHETLSSSSSVSFSANKEGDLWTGETSLLSAFSYGTWTVNVTATDNEGAVTEEEITVNILRP